MLVTQCRPPKVPCVGCDGQGTRNRGAEGQRRGRVHRRGTGEESTDRREKPWVSIGEKGRLRPERAPLGSGNRTGPGTRSSSPGAGGWGGAASCLPQPRLRPAAEVRPLQALRPALRDTFRPRECTRGPVMDALMRNWRRLRFNCSSVVQASSVSGPQQQFPELSKERGAQHGREEVGEQAEGRQGHEKPERARARVQRGQPASGAQRRRGRAPNPARPAARLHREPAHWAPKGTRLQPAAGSRPRAAGGLGGPRPARLPPFPGPLLTSAAQSARSPGSSAGARTGRPDRTVPPRLGRGAGGGAGCGEPAAAGTPRLRCARPSPTSKPS